MQRGFTPTLFAPSSGFCEQAKRGVRFTTTEEQEMKESFDSRTKAKARKVSGFGLIEVVIGSAILATTIWSIAGYYQQALKVSQSTGQIMQASFLLEEGVEVAQFFRDNSWSNISGMAAGTPYYLVWGGTAWATSTTPSTVDGTFTRSIVASDVYRDGNDDITTSGGTIDTGTREITATVTWNDHGTTASRSLSAYLTNIF